MSWSDVARFAWELKEAAGEVEAFANIAHRVDVEVVGRYSDRAVGYFRPGALGTTTYYFVISRDLVDDLVVVPIEEEATVSKARLRALQDYHGPHTIVKMLEEGEHRA